MNFSISLYFKCYSVKTQILECKQFPSLHRCLKLFSDFFSICLFPGSVCPNGLLHVFWSQNKYLPVQVQVDVLIVLSSYRINEN